MTANMFGKIMSVDKLEWACDAGARLNEMDFFERVEFRLPAENVF
jgi:hypothetical protein